MHGGTQTKLNHARTQLLQTSIALVRIGSEVRVAGLHLGGFELRDSATLTKVPSTLVATIAVPYLLDGADFSISRASIQSLVSLVSGLLEKVTELASASGLSGLGFSV